MLVSVDAGRVMLRWRGVEMAPAFPEIVASPGPLAPPRPDLSPTDLPRLLPLH